MENLRTLSVRARTDNWFIFVTGSFTHTLLCLCFKEFSILLNKAPQYYRTFIVHYCYNNVCSILCDNSVKPHNRIDHRQYYDFGPESNSNMSDISEIGSQA